MTMQQTVYVVIADHDSPAHVHGVFSTQAGAEQYVADTGSGRIEVAQVDVQAGRVFKTCYTVQINAVTGETLTSCVQPRAMYVPHAQQGASEVMAGPAHEPHSAIVCGHSYVSPDHAYRVACEARQAWLQSQPDTRFTHQPPQPQASMPSAGQTADPPPTYACVSVPGDLRRSPMQDEP